MTDNFVRREVQRRDDPFGIPACFYWTIDEVADWVDSIGYGKYKENFRSHFINGRKLLTVDACALPKMGITHFGDILTIAKHVRDQLHIQDRWRKVETYAPHLRKTYVGQPQKSGHLALHLCFQQHMNNVEHILNSRINYLKSHNYTYTGWAMEPWWDQELRAEEEAAAKQSGRASTVALVGGTLQGRLAEAANRVVDRKTRPSSASSGRRPSVSSEKQEGGSKSSAGSKPGRQGPRGSQGAVTFETKQEGDPKGSRRASKGLPRKKFLIQKHKPWRPGPKPVNRPYLPIIFVWEKMKETKGYPQLEIVTQTENCMA